MSTQKRHSILVIHDVEPESPKGPLMWAYARRSHALVRYAPPDLSIDRCPHADIPWESLSQYDLVYHLDYTSLIGSKIKRHAPNAVTVVSYNKDHRSVFHRWEPCLRDYDFVVCNNRDIFDYTGRQPRTCNISNGVDGSIFRYITPIEQREHRVFWRGSSTPRKGKNWQSVIEPAIPRLKELGFIPDFQPIDEIVPELVLATDELVEKYNQCSYVICAASSEGTPCTALEGMACGCVNVSTVVGNLPEYGVDGENCIVIEPTVDSLVDGLCRARENREKLSENGTQTMHERWSYGEPGNRAQYFYSLLRRAIEDGPSSIKPFSHLEKHYSEI